jgi:hypothetical protein
MKFVDLINEDFTPNEKQLKELKSTKAVFIVNRKGIVKYKGHLKNDESTIVGYKLGEPEYKWYPRNGNKNDMYLSVHVKNLTVYIKDPVLYDAIVVNPDRMQDYYGTLIYNYIIPKARRRFERHKVKLHVVGEPVVEFVFVEPKETKDPEQINEDPTVGEQNQLSDKEMKNFKALWVSFKEGVFKYNDKKYRYQLKNEYDVFKMPTTAHASSRIVILINGAFESSIRVYEIQDNGHNVLLDYGLENRLYSLVKAKVKRNFASHNVHLHL